MNAEIINGMLTLLDICHSEAEALAEALDSIDSALGPDSKHAHRVRALRDEMRNLAETGE